MHVKHKAGLGLTLIGIALGLTTPHVARAEVITFDDLISIQGGVGILNGYHGFNWNNFGATSVPDLITRLGPGSSGYVNGVVSSPNVAFNGGGTPASFGTLSSPFTLNSAYFAGAWNDGLNITVQGLDSSNVVIDSTSFIVNTFGSSLKTFNWSGLSMVTVSSSGGTLHSGFVGSGTHFSMDNLTVNAPAAAAIVPESSGLANMSGALLALGLSGLVMAVKKKTKTSA